MLNLVFATNLQPERIMDDLYRYLRKGKEYTHIPDLFLVNDYFVSNLTGVGDILESSREDKEIYFVIESIFSGYVLTKGLSELRVDFRMFEVLDRLLNDPKENDISLISSILREVKEDDVYRMLFIQANRATLIGEEFGRAARDLTMNALFKES